MNKGDFVIFRNPIPEEMFNGEPLRFVVTEVNGDRCFIEPVTSSLYYKPVALVRVDELEVVEGDK